MLKSQLRVLLFVSMYCSLLVVFRVALFNTYRYLFLIWNLFLAWIPYLIALKIQNQVKSKVHISLLVFSFVVWLLFFPNAPYVITDFVHLRAETRVPLLYDILMIFSFASLSITLGFISLNKIENVLVKKFGNSLNSLIILILMFLSGYGIYLGRKPQLNSWDVFLSPIRLITVILNTVNLEALAFTLFFGIFLFVFYVSVKQLIRLKD